MKSFIERVLKGITSSVEVGLTIYIGNILFKYTEFLGVIMEYGRWLINVFLPLLLTILDGFSLGVLIALIHYRRKFRDISNE